MPNGSSWLAAAAGACISCNHDDLSNYLCQHAVVTLTKYADIQRQLVQCVQLSITCAHTCYGAYCRFLLHILQPEAAGKQFAGLLDAMSTAAKQ